MEKLKSYIILGLALTVMVLWLKKCNRIEVHKKTYIVTEDKWDTVHTPPIHVYHPAKPGGTAVDSFPIHDTTKLHLCDFQRTYKDSIDDVNQTITYTAKTTGVLDSIKLDYKLKTPMLITHTVTNEVIKHPKWSLYGGMEVGAGDKVNISPQVNLQLNNKLISYRYGILDGSHNIGVSILLIKSKK